MEKREDQFLWVEAYRPRTLRDCILPESMYQEFQSIIDSGQAQNMIFSGQAGTGKTTVARAICNDLGATYMLINGSEESGIDVLRTKIKQFASTVSFNGRPKVIILDEAYYLNPNSTQPALRGFIEEFSSNCRFILTCNFKNKIIPPLHSRCAMVEFKIPKNERPKIAAKYLARCKEILQAENIEYNDTVLANLLLKTFPDFRKTINILQRHSATGEINASALSTINDSAITELVDALTSRDWKKMRGWVVANLDNDAAYIYRKLSEELVDRVSDVPQLVLILADYAHKSAFVADQELNLVACLTEIMAGVGIGSK
jgi:DNA polymerase III delta prime subunit